MAYETLTAKSINDGIDARGNRIMLVETEEGVNLHYAPECEELGCCRASAQAFDEDGGMHVIRWDFRGCPDYPEAEDYPWHDMSLITIERCG